MRRNKEKDIDLRMLLSNLGFIFEVFQALLVAMFAIGGKLDHLRRVVKEPELAKKLARLIVPEEAKPGALPADHYRVMITDLAVPVIAELMRLFDWVNDLWDGTRYALQTHSSCVGIVPAAGEKIFWVRDFGREMTSDEVIAQADKDGYRPATLAEAIVFAAANPDLQRQFRIVVLGSFALYDGRRRVPVLDGGSGGSGGRELDGRWFGDGWRAGYRFLLVRK